MLYYLFTHEHTFTFYQCRLNEQYCTITKLNVCLSLRKYHIKLALADLTEDWNISCHNLSSVVNETRQLNI